MATKEQSKPRDPQTTDAMTATELTHHLLRRASHAVELAITLMEDMVGERAKHLERDARDPR